MAVVGHAQINVDAVTTGFKKSIRNALSDADKEAIKVYDSVNALIEKSYYIQGALVGASGAVASLAGGLFALGSQAAAATPALIVLPSIFSAMGQAAITAKLAFGGLGQAIGKAFKQKTGGGGVDKMPGLLQAMDSATERYRNAVNRTNKAEARLNEVRKEAAERIEQLKFGAEDAAISEKKAGLELQKARESLARAQDLPPNSRARKEAELAFQEADLNYRRAIDKNSDLKKEVAEVTADGTRSAEEEVENSKEVVAAKDALTEATYDEKRADDAKTLAKKKLADAEKGIGGGGGGGGDPFAGLNESQKKFAKFIVDLKPKIDELKESAGKNLFPKLEIAIQNLVDKLFPSLNKILADTGTALGDAAIDFSKIVTEADNLKNLNTVAGTNKDTIGKLGTVVGNLYSTFLSLLSAADPLVRRFTDWVVTLTDGWKASVEARNQTGKLTKIFNDAGDVAAQLGRIISNIGGAFLEMGKAAAGPGSGGQMIFDYLEEATEKFKTFAKTTNEDGSLAEYFRVVSENFTKVLDIIGKVAGAIMRTGNDKGTGQFLDSISKAVDVLAGALGKLSEGGAGGAFGKFIEQMAEFIAHTTEAGSLKMYFGIMTAALSLLNKVLSNPIAQKLLIIAAAAHASRTAFRTLNKSVEVFSKYLTGDKINIKQLITKIKGFGPAIGALSGNFKAARAMQMSYFASLKMTIGYTKIGAAATKAWTAIQAAFTAVMATTVGPILLIIVGIVALIAIVVVMYKKFEWFRDFVHAVWDGIKTATEVYWNALKMAFDIVWSFIIGYIQTGWTIIKLIFEAFKIVFNLAWDGIKLYFNIVWGIIKTAISFGWNNIIKPIFTAFGTVFATVWDGIKGAFTTTWDFIKDAIQKGKAVFDGIGEAIKTAFKTAFNFVASIWNKTVGKLRFEVPSWVPGIGGKGFDVPQIPELAEGGIIKPIPGGTLARIGEAGRAERVEPLDPDGLSKRDKAMIKLLAGNTGGGVNITVNPSPGMDEVELASLISRQLALQLRRGAA